MEALGVWESEGMSTQVWYGGGLLYLKLHGVINLDAYYQAAAFTAGLSLTHPFSVLIVDCLSGIMTITPDDMQRARPMNSALAQKWRPGCYIVDEGSVPMFRQLCWRLAQMGLERRVFSAGKPALVWARERAVKVKASAALRASSAMLAANPGAVVPTEPAPL